MNKSFKVKMFEYLVLTLSLCLVVSIVLTQFFYTDYSIAIKIKNQGTKQLQELETLNDFISAMPSKRKLGK